MTRLKQLWCLCLLATSFHVVTVLAQGVPLVRSPEWDQSGQVTFRLQAPQAQSVELSGDWPGGVAGGSRLPMTKQDNGIWSITLASIKPEVWSYQFVVDGVAMPDPQNVQIQRNGGRYASELIVSDSSPRDYQMQAVPHGTLAAIWYDSPTLSLTRRALIYLPPGYEQSKRRYPVLYLLHGGGGDEEAWDTLGRLSVILDNQIAQGRAQPMIVVMPNGNANQVAAQSVVAPPPPTMGPHAPIASMSTIPGNGPDGGPGMHSFPHSIVRDLIPYIDRTYRTQARREQRAIAGLSMGGAQAFYAAFNHLDAFAWVGSFSGGFTLLPGVSVVIPLPDNAATLRGPDIRRSIDPAKFSAALPQLNASANAKLKLLYVSMGTSDTLTTTHQVVTSVLRDQGVQYTLVEPVGHIHDWAMWRLSLSDFLPRLFR